MEGLWVNWGRLPGRKLLAYTRLFGVSDLSRLFEGFIFVPVEYFVCLFRFLSEVVRLFSVGKLGGGGVPILGLFLRCSFIGRGFKGCFRRFIVGSDTGVCI